MSSGVEIERKFLVDGDSLNLQHPALSGAKVINTQQVYLSMPGRGEFRIRRKRMMGETTYVFTRKRDISPTTRVEDEEEISFFKYWLLRLLRKVKYTGVIRKVRHVFFWRGQVFELDIFRRPRGLVLLEIELKDEDQDINLPPFLRIVREVTGEPKYKNSNIAKRI